MVGSSISSKNTCANRPASSISLAAPPQRYSVPLAAAIKASRRAGSQAQLCRDSHSRSGASGSATTTLPAPSTVRASNGSSSESIAARPRLASTVATVVFPAPEQPVIWTALICAYGAVSDEACASEFPAQAVEVTIRY